LEILSFTGNNQSFQGRIYRATISNSIGGTPVVDFNPATYNASTSQTQWTSATGEVWTINTGTATTGYKGVLVDRTIVQSDGVDDQLNVTSFILNQPMSIYISANRYTPTAGNDYLFDLGQNKIVIYSSPALAYAGNGLPYSPTIANSILGMYKFICNSTNSILGVNNLTEQTLQNVGTRDATAIALFGSFPTQAVNSNAIITSFVIASQADDTTNRTAMYNLIRSLNNNAF